MDDDASDGFGFSDDKEGGEDEIAEAILGMTKGMD